jgi:hypothetical protein
LGRPAAFGDAATSYTRSWMAAAITRKLKWLTPMAKFLAAAQVGLLARRHWHRLERDERRRVMWLLRSSRGRRRNLSPDERAELAQLVAKSDPRLFAGLAAQRFSPVRLPRRVVQGKKTRR